MNRSLSSLIALNLLFSPLALAGEAQSPRADIDLSRSADGIEGEDQVWSAWGGELHIAWNRELLADIGVRLSAPKGLLGAPEHGVERLGVRETVGFQFNVRGRAFNGFAGGALSVQGGYELEAGGRRIPLRDFSLRPRPGNPWVLDVVSGDGEVWFEIDRIMYALESDAPVLALHAMDLRATPAFAKLLGRPYVEGMTLAGMKIEANIFRGGFDKYVEGCPDSSRWPGMEVTPGGPRYEADVFMMTFHLSYSRKTADADGPGGSDGGVVFTPSSRLKNNRNNGSPVQTVNDGLGGLGTSDALYAADVVWRTKFTENCPPYDNDQHPFLIWNVYRIDADGRIEQVGRSGVKHAFLTINVSCDAHPGSGYILGRGCEDVYSEGNNDSNSALGPRREILPATGQWGRCGSIYDPNCDGSSGDFGGFTSYDHRMIARESKIDPAANPGASWLFESWYIVRDDVNIYNTMQTRPGGFSWSGSTWNTSNGSPLKLGPAIDRWVDPASSAPGQRNTELVLTEGRSKAAVRTTDLGDGRHRYDYAVMNFEFGQPVTQGAEPNLRVVSNDGFLAFRVPIPAGATVQDLEFGDGDIDAGNDWTATVEPEAVVWTAPTGAALNWGTLFRFSLVVDAAPEDGEVGLLRPTRSTTDLIPVANLRPAGATAQVYGIGGEVTGLPPGLSLRLALNDGNDIEIDANGAFAFPHGRFDGSAYAVAVVAQPEDLDCDVSNASGTIAGADVMDVQVVCAVAAGHQVGGTVTGLISGELGLGLNGVETLQLTANGPFQFQTALPNGANYEVTVSSQPFEHDCSVAQGEGAMGNLDVNSVQVSCESITQVLSILGDAWSLDEDSALTVAAPGVLANDSGAPLPPQAGEVVTPPAHGSLHVALGADGSFGYQPEADFCGQDSFVYRAQAGSASAEAEVVLQVACVEDAPRALGVVPDRDLLEGESLLLPLAGFFFEPDGQALSFSALGLPEGLEMDGATGTVSGTVGAASAGSPYYVLVRASDGSGLPKAQQRFVLRVTAVGDAVFGDGFEPLN